MVSEMASLREPLCAGSVDGVGDTKHIDLISSRASGSKHQHISASRNRLQCVARGDVGVRDAGAVLSSAVLLQSLDRVVGELVRVADECRSYGSLEFRRWHIKCRARPCV